ncbi:MAG: PAS domain S-box protein, partial [Pseudomonadota bacterium]|nr:PAS domain S-box protein [Pseudomonadota bacterium]
MLRVLDCVGRQHDLRLVALAAVVCVIACLTTVSLYGRATASRSRGRVFWLCATALVFGSGVWATHFIAELAYRSAAPLGFAATPTVLSLAIAVAGSLAGFALAMLGRQGRASVLAGGALVGLTIGAMHYTGMAAVRSAMLSYAPALIAASLLLGAAGAAAALTVQNRVSGLRGRIAAAALLVLAICGLHFTGMAAVTLLPLAVAATDTGTLAGNPLAVAVAAVAVAFLLLLGLAGAIFDQVLTGRSIGELRRFRRFADATFEGILFHRDGLVTDVNAALCGLLGEAPERLLGRKLHELLPALPATVTQSLGGAIEIELVNASGARRTVEVLTRTIHQGGQPVTVVAVRDITERKVAESRIEQLARYDTLTGLANRSLFHDRLT